MHAINHCPICGGGTPMASDSMVIGGGEGGGEWSTTTSPHHVSVGEPMINHNNTNITGTFSSNNGGFRDIPLALIYTDLRSLILPVPTPPLPPTQTLAQLHNCSSTCRRREHLIITLQQAHICDDPFSWVHLSIRSQDWVRCYWLVSITSKKYALIIFNQLIIKWHEFDN